MRRSGIWQGQPRLNLERRRGVATSLNQASRPASVARRASRPAGQPRSDSVSPAPVVIRHLPLPARPAEAAARPSCFLVQVERGSLTVADEDLLARSTNRPNRRSPGLRMSSTADVRLVGAVRSTRDRGRKPGSTQLLGRDRAGASIPVQPGRQGRGRKGRRPILARARRRQVPRARHAESRQRFGQLVRREPVARRARTGAFRWASCGYRRPVRGLVGRTRISQPAAQQQPQLMGGRRGLIDADQHPDM